MDQPSEQLGIAVDAALNNIKNCIRLKGKFSTVSFEHFGNNHPPEFELLKQLTEDTKDPAIWISKCLITACRTKSSGEIEKLYKLIGTAEENLVENIDNELNKFGFFDLRLDNENDHNSSVYEDPDEEEQQTVTEVPKTLAEQVKGIKTSEWRYHSRSEIHIEKLRSQSQNVREWFRRFELQTVRWSNEDRGLDVACFFEEVALCSYELIEEELCHDYEYIKLHMIDRMQPNVNQRAEFYRTTQRVDESADQYGHRLQKLISEMPIRDREALRQDLPSVFKGGCRPEIQRALIGTNKLYPYIFFFLKSSKK